MLSSKLAGNTCRILGSCHIQMVFQFVLDLFLKLSQRHISSFNPKRHGLPMHTRFIVDLRLCNSIIHLHATMINSTLRIKVKNENPSNNRKHRRRYAKQPPRRHIRVKNTTLMNLIGKDIIQNQHRHLNTCKDPCCNKLMPRPKPMALAQTQNENAYSGRHSTKHRADHHRTAWKEGGYYSKKEDLRIHYTANNNQSCKNLNPSDYRRFIRRRLNTFFV